MKAYGIVRDRNGKPKFDDPSNVPQAIKEMLTIRDIQLLSPEERQALGLTIADDAQGT